MSTKSIDQDEIVFEGFEDIALNGSFITIYKDANEVYILSVPSPNLFADNYRDSVDANDDIFDDEEENSYNIEAVSSNTGVDWTVTVKPKLENSAEQLKKRLEIKYEEGFSF